MGAGNRERWVADLEQGFFCLRPGSGPDDDQGIGLVGSDFMLLEGGPEEKDLSEMDGGDQSDNDSDTDESEEEEF